MNIVLTVLYGMFAREIIVELTLFVIYIHDVFLIGVKINTSDLLLTRSQYTIHRHTSFHQCHIYVWDRY